MRYRRSLAIEFKSEFVIPGGTTYFAGIDFHRISESHSFVALVDDKRDFFELTFLQVGAVGHQSSLFGTYHCG